MEDWLDLSDYGLQLLLVKSAKGHYLVVFGDNALSHLPKLKAMQFLETPRRPEMVTASVPLRNDGTLPPDRHPTLARWQAAFPNARQVPYDRAVHFRDHSTQAAVVRNAPVTMAMPATVLGLNKSGQEVVADANGVRWAKDDRGSHFAEGGPGDTVVSPATFLRAHREGTVEPDLLALCAEGFCEQAFRGNNPLREDDFGLFLSVTHPVAPAPGSDPYRAARDAVEAASARMTHRKGRNALAAAFNASVTFHDRLGFLSDGRGPATRGAAGPLGIAAQGLAGTEATLKGRRVLVHNPGMGNAFSGFPASCEVSFSGDVDADGTRRMLAVNGLRAGTARPGDAHDAQVVELRRAGGGPAPTPAGPLTRADLAEALRILAGRADEGNSAFVLDGPANDAERQEFAAFRDHVSQAYSFDGEAVVDGATWAGTDAADAKHLLAVGWRRVAPDAQAFPPVPRQVHDWGALFKWRSDVVRDRPAMPAPSPAAAAGGAKGLVGGAKSAFNEFQAPYACASRIGAPRTMVPRNLEGATKAALRRVMERKGDVDALVAAEYGYTPAEMASIFSPEQVDALALRVSAEDRGRGFLVADQMGVGKGRFLAACIRRSILKGKRVLFLTERQTNLSDIVRDLRHTKTLDLLNYRIVNDGVQVINEDTKEVERRSDPRPEIDAILASGRWPDDGTNLILGTYSQFSANLERSASDAEAPERGVRNAKSKWLVTAVDERCDIVADECHNAASHTSNVSKNLSQALARSPTPVFSSASFAHKGSHMPFYAPLLPDGMTSEELSHMLDKGGESFQEVLSGMLVSDGVMIRREFDLSDLVIETIVDSARIERNRDVMDAIAPVLSAFSSLDELAAARVATMNAAAREQAQGEREPRPRGRRRRGEAPQEERRGSVTRAGHGSFLYSITRLVLSSLKVDMTVDLALASLRNDEKPVIFVENTVESLLSEVGIDADAEDTGLGPDIRTLFRRVLRQSVSARDRTGAVETRRDLREGSDALASAHDRVAAMIEDLPPIPLSAIDEIKRRIGEAGFTCGEITGRSLEVLDGKVVRRAVPNPTEVKNDFNSGHLDAVVINNSGATGVDLHAGVRFADQRRRHMIEHQIPSDVVKATQGRGRTNRYDQVVAPRYTTPLAGLPAEVRLAALDNARMRRLSATTTSNRHTASLSRGIPDLINQVGDAVCAEYAQKRPDVMRLLGFKVTDIEENSDRNLRQELATEADLKEFVTKRRKAASVGDETSKVADSKRSANEILSRLIMLPVSLQEKVCAELTAEYHAAIEELEAKGETPLRTHELPGIVHPRTKNGVVEQEVFEGSDVEDPDSVFDEPLYMVDAALERVAKAMTGDDLLQLVEMGESATGRKRQCLDRLASGMEEILRDYLPENMPSVALALEAGSERVRRQKGIIEAMAVALETLGPGSEVSYTVEGERVRAIVTGVTYAERGMEHVPGSYRVDFAAPGDARTRSMSLRTLMRDPAFEVGPGLASENADRIVKGFDNAVNVTVSSVKLMRNNVYRGLRLAVEHGIGSLKMYRLADGTLERGVVVSKNMHHLKAVPVPIEGYDMAVAALKKGFELIGDNRGGDKLLTLKSTDGETVVVKLPPASSRRYGHIYEDPTIRNLANRVGQDAKGSTTVTVAATEMRGIMKGLKATGTGLWTTSVARDWANGYLRENRRREEADDLLPAYA